MAHSYEEVRELVYEIVLGPSCPHNYQNLVHAVGEAFRIRDGLGPRMRHLHSMNPTLPDDADVVLEVFWDLFRDGTISLGFNNSNPDFPWFSLTRRAERLKGGENHYFLRDVSNFEIQVKDRVPEIEDSTLTYLKEALQAFRAGAILASTVMLGVAAEDLFETVIEMAANNPSLSDKMRRVLKERTAYGRIEEFRKVISNNPDATSKDLREDLETRFFAIQSLIREFRNESGHPSGVIIGREQAFMNLQLFIPFARKAHDLIEHFNSGG